MRTLNFLLIAALLGALQGCFPVVAVGAGAGVLMAADRRTPGAYIEDETIEDKSLSQIANKFKDTVHVNVTSFNRHILLTGEVPDAAAKAEVEKIVAAVPNVKVINNELATSGLSGLASRSSDTVITGDVKLRFLNNPSFQANNIKVITENSVVYLMGMVYRKEAAAASDIASTTRGVQRVVKVFEYLD